MFGWLLGFYDALFKNSSFRFVAAFAKKINLLILIPVFSITALFISGMIDSGFMQQLLDFLTQQLNMLQSYSYRCARLLPDIGAYVACFK